MKRGPAICAGLVLALILGCGSTHIRTEDGARIYVNGRMIGKGHGELRQRGGRGKATVIVKAKDGRRARMQIRRRFDGWTVLSCPFTYLIGCFANLSYPASIYVDLPPPANSSGADWDGSWSGQGGDDIWMRPPPGWSEPVRSSGAGGGRADADAPPAPGPGTPQSSGEPQSGFNSPPPNSKDPPSGFDAPPPGYEDTPPTREAPPPAVDAPRSDRDAVPPSADTDDEASEPDASRR